MKLEAGQVAVVTGAASGIGLALAEAFAERGMSVVLADLRTAEVEASAAKVAETYGTATLAVTTDVRDAASVEALAEATTDRFGRVDVVCNNAGVIGPIAPSWELDAAVFRWLVDVALMGVVHGVLAFVPRMIAGGGRGHILNTSSMAGLMPQPGIASYGIAKYGVVGFTETLRVELAMNAPGIGASVLCPGYVPSDLGISSRQTNPDDVPLAPLESAAGTDLPQEAGMTLQDVSSAALAGIEADQAHVIVYRGGNYDADIRARVQGVLDDLPPVGGV